jgi:quercetin dioxygenase-like cupin family protein
MLSPLEDAMAIHHAKPNELVDLNEWPHDVTTGRSHTLISVKGLQLARIILKAGQEMPSHSLAATVIIQVIGGAVTLQTGTSRQSVNEGQLVYLAPDETHSITALDDAVVLLTILRH